MVSGNERRDMLIKIVSRIIAQSDLLCSDEPQDPKVTAIEIIETLAILGFLKGSK